MKLCTPKHFLQPPSLFYELFAPKQNILHFLKKQFANWPTALKKKPGLKTTRHPSKNFCTLKQNVNSISEKPSLIGINNILFVYLVEKYPDHFSDLFHALDIWHKTIKLTKKLAKVSRGSIKPLFFTSHYK